MLDIDPTREGVPPVDAATIVPLRDAASGLEVFLIQRARASKFMGGAFVFPGGKVDPVDAQIAEGSRLEGRSPRACAEVLGEGQAPGAAAALFVAAIRETFEEAGLFVGTHRAPTLEALRNTPFAEALEAHDARLALDRLVPLSRWVTPSVEKRRFDARFFLLEVPFGVETQADPHETSASRWQRPADALAEHAAGSIDLPPPTLRTLELLASYPTASAAIEAHRGVKPPLVRPVFRPLDPWILALPGDPEHPEPVPVLAGSTRFVCRDARWFSA